MYGKIFSSMYEGTLYGQWEAIVTFQQLIVLCDSNGTIDMTPQAIAARTSIPLNIITKGLELLSDPDQHSRTNTSEGRRIELIDDHRPWGWTIVNHRKYKMMANAEEKRESDRLRIAAKRASNNDVAECRKVSQGVANVAHTNTDTNTDTNNKTISSNKSDNALNESKKTAKALHDDAVEVLEFLNLKRPEVLGHAVRGFSAKTAANLTDIKSRLRDGSTVTDCRKVIANRMMAWSSNPEMHQYLTPQTLFRARNFAKYIAALPVVTQQEEIPNV